MAEEKKEKQQEDAAVAQDAGDAAAKEIIEMSNRCSRSTIAVIDAVCQRGGFKGEELTTIGQLRDQCISIVQMYESLNQKSA